MSITLQENVEPCRDRFIVSFDKEQVTVEIDKIVKKVIKDNKIKGFRKGKAKPEIVKSLAKETILNEAQQVLFHQAYEEVLRETKYKPFGSPELKKIETTYSKFEVDFSLAYNPIFDLVKYKDFDLHEPTNLPSKDEITEASIKEACKSKPTLTAYTENDCVENGDVIIVNYSSTIDGEKFDKSDASHLTIELGSGKFNADFETNVLGMKAGETREFDVTFPADVRNNTIAGKTIHFVVNVVAGVKRIPSEFNEELAKQFNCDSLDALREQINKFVDEKIVSARQKHIFGDIYNLLLENNTIDVPVWMQEQSAKYMSSVDGFKWEENSDQVKEAYMKKGLNTLKMTLIMNKIREIELETVLSYKELNKVMINNLSMFPEETRKILLDEKDPHHTQRMSQIYSEIQDEFVFTWIMNNSNVSSEHKTDSTETV